MKKYLLFILVLVLSFSLFGCDHNKDDEVVDHGDVIDLKVREESLQSSYEYDEYDFHTIMLRVIYNDGYYEDIPLSEDYLSDYDIERLSKPGEPRITINVGGYEIKQVIKLVDSAARDKDLNKNGDYEAVFKAIRSNNTINFIVDPKKGVNAIQVEYLFDSSIMQLVETSIKKNKDLNGELFYQLENGKLTVIYSGLENIEAETIVFSVDFTGNFRTSQLRINEDFDNVLSTKVDDSYTYDDIAAVLYHVSIK